MTQPGVNPLAGRTVVVTGAGRGLGRALVAALTDAGANTVGCARSASDLDQLSRTLASDRLLALQADVTDPAAMRHVAASAVERFGGIDGLVLNASILDPRRPLREVDPDEWRRVIDVNLNGAFNACRAVVPILRQRGGGSIVAVSSGAANRPRRDWGAYAVSKQALEAFALNLALEEADAGVRVNVVDPGAMRTTMRAAAYPDEDPATLPDPADHLGVYLWLLGPASAAVSGERFTARGWSGPG